MEQHQVRYNNKKFKISAPSWNETFDLSGGSYSISDIQHYFEYIIKKHETLTENSPVQIYPNKIKSKIVFKIKTGNKLELLTPETMKLLRSTNKDVDKDKDGEIVPKLESVEDVLVHCNLVKHDYQHTAKGLFSFVPNKQFGQLINISPHSLTMINTVPPGIKTSQRRLSVRPSDVPGTSQMKHPMTSRSNVTQTSQWFVSTTSYWNVIRRLKTM